MKYDFGFWKWEVLEKKCEFRFWTWDIGSGLISKTDFTLKLQESGCMKLLISVLCGCLPCCIVNAQTIPAPPGYEMIQEAIGDLDKDGIPEKAVVYNTVDTSEETGGIIRELILYKKDGTGWKTRQQSRNAVYDSKSGGMMGDPFEGIDIKNGILHISQAGGSSWKWGHTDKYRFQHGRLELIGYSELR
jgi:hypothetical protein